MMKPTRILLAEDDADDRDLFLEALSKVDPSITVATVEDGEKLLDHLKNAIDIPDCIFLDLNMPKKNGRECLSEIRRNEKTEKVPVIIYTTSLNLNDINETFKRGASCFIRKPNSFSELTGILNTYITNGFQKPDHYRLKRNFVLK